MPVSSSIKSKEPLKSDGRSSGLDDAEDGSEVCSGTPRFVAAAVGATPLKTVYLPRTLSSIACEPDRGVSSSMATTKPSPLFSMYVFSCLKSTFVVDVSGNSVLRTARTMPEAPELGNGEALPSTGERGGMGGAELDEEPLTIREGRGGAVADVGVEVVDDVAVAPVGVDDPDGRGEGAGWETW